MVRRIRYSMLAVMIIALCAVIAFSSTRFQQPAPPKNDLERLGLKGPIYQVSFSRTSTLAVTYTFNTVGDIEEEILYQNNKPFERIQYFYGSDGEMARVVKMNENGAVMDTRSVYEGDQLFRNQLYTDIPLESTVPLKTQYHVKRGMRKNYDRHGNWTSQRIDLSNVRFEGYVTNVMYSWLDNRSIQYFDDLVMQPEWSKTSSASIEFLPVP
ncbi:MAG: hypothetical protein P9L94_05080 [Candidatus Hinthialibacter antarcticus]|nr:hypothetical protein [Candidatus Hinthialibacter antarcticus]